MLRFISFITITLLLIAVYPALAQESAPQPEPSIRAIAHNLLNPRGTLVLPDGRLLVVEAGTGFRPGRPQEYSGRVSLFDDLNGDGDYDDEGERQPILEALPTYNTLTVFNTGSDEVGGSNDIVRLTDNRLLITRDEHAEVYLADGDPSVIGITQIAADFSEASLFEKTSSTVNALAYDAQRDRVYAAESGRNRLFAIDSNGELLFETFFPNLAHGQQAVPAGLALDPRNGDVLVALFSGSIYDYGPVPLTFLPGDSKIVRVNPETGAISDFITGLTTAVDVAMNEAGDVFVVEFTQGWPTIPMPEGADLFDPEALPDPGGYVRFAGRVTRYPADGSTPMILADGLDTPTNISYHAGNLYVSTGQGTPGRPIWGPEGATRIEGALYLISGFEP